VIAFWLLLLCAAGMVAAQDAVPGLPLYHYGWWNGIDIAFFVLAAMQLRTLRKTGGERFSGLLAALFGAAIVVLTGVASGLMGPDTHTIVGAPGQSVRSDDMSGSFLFPLQGTAIQLQRGNSVITIDGGRRYTGGFILWQEPRTVVSVEAADARGNHLTITQPTNASFLSPVLLMQQSTTIAGMDVRFDTFSVPALQRIVKAVLFDPQQAAQLHSDVPASGKAAVLFAVSDNADRVLPHGIALVVSGERKTIAGLQLQGTAGTYPAIVLASAPYLPIMAVGFVLVLIGAFRSRSPGGPAR
jgi:hypothetical protein